MRLLRTGDLEKAAQTLERAAGIAEDAGVRNAYTLPVYAWIATTRRMQAEQDSDCTPLRRESLLQEAATAARQAIGCRWLYRNDLSQALREYALVLAMQGKLRRARRMFDRSLRVAEQLGARYQYALSLLAKAKVGKEAGWANAETQLATAQSQLAEIQAPEEDDRDGGARGPVNLSLVDRFDTVLDSGRRIASALAISAIHEAARAAALRMLRGEQCLVLQLEQDENGIRVAPPHEHVCNRALLERAYRPAARPPRIMNRKRWRPVGRPPLREKVRCSAPRCSSEAGRSPACM